MGGIPPSEGLVVAVDGSRFTDEIRGCLCRSRW